MSILKVGKEEDNLTEDEKIAILKERNGTRTSTNELAAPSSHLYGLNYSFTGGISKNIWSGLNPDMIQIRNVIETFFVQLFEWEGIDRNFKHRMEHILFKEGRVAIVKLPNGEIYPVEYTHNDDYKDFYGNPLRINITTDNDYNGAEFKEGEFVIIYNNHVKHGTMTFMYERLRQVVRALRDVDNASTLSSPKWAANISSDDQAWVDVLDAMNSDLPVVPMGNIDFKEAGITDISGTDYSDSRMSVFKFQLSTMLKFLGLKVNDGQVKAERQTEMEVSRNDEFDSQIFQDMYNSRFDKLEELRALGLTIDLKETELINGEDPDKDEVNGEVNKVIQGEEND